MGFFADWRGWTVRAGVIATATILLAGASSAGRLIPGGLTSQPIGHFEFCKANPSECSIRTADRGPERYGAGLVAKIAAVNTAVNKAVRPVSDYEVHGRDEVWSFPAQGVGDCEDYVLEKRRQLRRRGISYSNLLITVVRKRDGEGHAILTVRTDRGDFVLDNLTDKIRTPAETGYRFLKRQSSEHTGRWVSLRDDSNMLVGSVRQ